MSQNVTFLLRDHKPEYFQCPRFANFWVGCTTMSTVLSQSHFPPCSDKNQASSPLFSHQLVISLAKDGSCLSCCRGNANVVHSGLTGPWSDWFSDYHSTCSDMCPHWDFSRKWKLWAITDETAHLILEILSLVEIRPKRSENGQYRRVRN